MACNSLLSHVVRNVSSLVCHHCCSHHCLQHSHTQSNFRLKLFIKAVREHSQLLDSSSGSSSAASTSTCGWRTWLLSHSGRTALLERRVLSRVVAGFCSVVCPILQWLLQQHDMQAHVAAASTWSSWSRSGVGTAGTWSPWRRSWSTSPAPLTVCLSLLFSADHQQTRF